MKTFASIALGLLAATALSACGSKTGQTAANQTANTTANAAGTTASADPYADAEQNMDSKMMAAVGSDAGQTWAVKMIEHHQGAVDMARIGLKQGLRPDVAKMAQETIDKNSADIASIRALLKAGAADPKSADLYRPAMMDMKQKMVAATGADASELIMREMLEHHTGAVAMSDVALKAGVSGALRSQIERTRANNQKDSKMVEAMLAGKPMANGDHNADMSDMNMSGDMNGMNQM